MTKKKRHHPDVEEVLSRPWCYYCERDFDDLKILINHQKAKHFKCERCGRRLNTAGGLSVHMSQVHKENLTAVDNALPNRAGLDIEIFVMEGIPEDIVQQHHQRVLTNYHQAQAERQAATGNSAQNSANPNAPKKPKVEGISDIKARLAAHKAAKLAAEQGEGTSSGGNTPNTPAAAQLVQPQVTTVGRLQSLLYHFNSCSLQAAPPAYPAYQHQPAYAAPPTNGSFNQAPAFAQAPVAAPLPYQAPAAFPPAASPTTYGQQPYAPPPAAPFPQQPSPVGYPPQPSYSPPQYQPQYPGQSFPGQPAGLPRPPFAGSPPPGFPQQPLPLGQRAHSPATNGNFPAPVRTGSVSLPSAPGLPQRPAFGAPPVNAYQFQQMHQGQIPAPQSHNIVPQYAPGQAPPNSLPQAPPQVSAPAQPVATEAASSLDDLIANASRQADANAAAAAASAKTSTPPVAPPEPVEEKSTSKKEKEKDKGKATRLVYSDNETSPEEKMALLARYAFTPAQKTIAV
jgi:hypothetical protein